MGNCMFRGFEDFEQTIKILTPNGGIMEFYPPITVESITNEFPHHGIFRNGGVFSQPLLHKEELLTGELYHLLPLNSYRNRIIGADGYWSTGKSPKATYRMSFDHHKIWRRAETELVNKQNTGGIWKVKLVISPEKLTEILSQEDGTRALVESVRTVAKCSNVVSTASNSDLWSLSSSRKILSQEDGTRALVDSVRTVTKCSNVASTASNSDLWSLSSSRKILSENVV